MNKQTYTRAQYMNREVSHADYFRQFVTPGILRLVSGRIGIERIRASRDEHLNDIPLSLWDAMHDSMRALCGVAVSKVEGQYSLSDTVCIAKQAARMLMEQTKKSCVRVICDTGNTWVTEINTDIDGARAYFMGQKFTRENDNGIETVDTVTDVQEVTDNG